jgi:hypothetical protein
MNCYKEMQLDVTVSVVVVDNNTSLVQGFNAPSFGTKSGFESPKGTGDVCQYYQMRYKT